ncbi:MAG: D-sedoheptulose 7-phosphate isomerase [Bacteroidota bacterium]
MKEIVRASLLEARLVLDQYLSGEDNLEKIVEAAGVFASALKAGKKVISCGNGGSMCDAMHFAEELTGRYRDDRPPLAAVSISDPSHLTCTANDYGYSKVFSRFVEGFGNEGDVLLAISTSGNSENVIDAARSAARLGMKVVALTGKDGGKLAALADVELRVPWMGYADRIQEVHTLIIHNLIDLIERNT